MAKVKYCMPQTYMLFYLKPYHFSCALDTAHKLLILEPLNSPKQLPYYQFYDKSSSFLQNKSNFPTSLQYLGKYHPRNCFSGY